MISNTYIENIRSLIAQDNFGQAIEYLNALLANTPQLDEAILQSARFHNIRRQIRLGLVNHSEANLTQNQIRAGLLDLLREIEIKGETPAIREEIKCSISNVNSKNVVIDSTISAGGNIQIGDQTIHTESQTSQWLRQFLYVFVPVLAISGAFFWFQFQKMQTPISLTIAVHNQTPNTELPFQKGNIALQSGNWSDAKPIETETIFTGIPANFRDKKVSLQFESPGFFKIDTVFVLSSEYLVLPIRRDNSLALIFGTVKDESGNPLVGAQITVQDLATISQTDGTFYISIPFEKQRKSQRIAVFLKGYKPWDNTSPVFENEGIPIQLSSK